jgi:hypothetical protein
VQKQPKNTKNAFFAYFELGRNFDDYPGFQPKITPPKNFRQQCSIRLIKCFLSVYSKISTKIETLLELKEEISHHSKMPKDG